MTLNELIKDIETKQIINEDLLKRKFVKITSQVDEVIEGALFACVTVKKNFPNADIWFIVNKDREGEYYFNQHRYIQSAINAGAKFILCEELPKKFNDTVAYIQVDNVIEKLGKITRRLIAERKIRIIGITGSSGKTSTVHAIFQTLKQLNPNTAKVYTYRPTPITLPIISINQITNEILDEGTLIVEMPTDHHGCIATLCKITAPNIATILNIQDAHINIFGSQKEILKAKSEIFKSQRVSDIALLNVDDTFINQLLPSLKSKVIKYGKSENAELRAVNIKLHPHSLKFTAEYLERKEDFEIPLIGESALYIGLAVIGVCLALGYTLSEIKKPLKKYSPMKGRMSWTFYDRKRVCIFDNSEKTNTTNLRQLINETVKLPWQGKRIIVLGTYKSREHPHMENGIWTIMCNFYDKIILTGPKTHTYSNNFPDEAIDKVIKVDTIEQGAEKAFEEVLNNSETSYVTVVGYLPIPNKQAQHFGILVDSLAKKFSSKFGHGK